MNIRPYLFSILFSALCTLTLQAQTDVWPVQVSGSMLPPYSLNLKVYSLERAEDLSFNVMLRDPVQANLLVRPVITIEQNGSIIYQTDPNYAGKTILLSQFDQMLLNGAGLGEYLSNTALIGATANSTGSIEVPEGFNQICLQMYGVERNVPVSNKFCISGNFRLSQPPQIVKPSFNEKIKMPEVQNFVFSWQPMHIGSPNNPGPVEYTFELVELPMGVMNANDGFASALRVYSTKTMATSFIYTQGEPTLEPNKYYAWRVTATSVMYPTSKLFQNDGKGEVSVFVLYDGDEPGGDVNPFDKASPRGCSVYETSYGPVSKADNEAMIAAPNQNVKVGYFNMKITEAFGSQQQGYSGKGLIEYPMLRSVLEVEFKNIKVNKEGRVYEAERISAIVDPAIKIDVQDINKEKAEQVITANYINKLNTLLKKPNSDISKLAEGGTVLNSLPLSLQFDKQQPPVSVTGIELTPTNAYLNFISQTDDGGIYAATLIPSTPYGVKSNSFLTPLHVNGIERAFIKLIESIESGNVVSDNSKMVCNCKGYESLNSQSQLSVSTSIMKRTDNEAPVTFESIKKMDNYDNVITEVKNIPEFKVNRLDGFSFKAKSGELDLSTSGNGFSPNANEYASKQSAGWKGLRLKDVQVTIPEKFNFINPKSKLVLDKGEIYIDENELAYGHFSKTDVLSLNKGKMGPWNYSIDTMKVTMDARQIGKFRLSGAIKTPFFDDRFPYQAVVAEAGQKQIKLDAVIPATKLGMGIWHGTFLTQSPSSVDARLVDLGDEKQLTPKCNFTGDLAAKFTDKEFRNAILNTNKGVTLDALKNALKIDNFDFDLSGLRLTGLSNDPMQEREKRFKIEGFDLKNVHLAVGGASFQLTAAALEYKAEEKRERLGLKTIIIKESSKVELTIWAESVNGTFRFEGVEVNSIDLKCNCGVANVIPSKESWDRIIDQFYDSQYMISYVDFSKSGVQSVHPAMTFNIGKELALEEIKRNAIAWFPALNNNNAINIPFLDRNLSIENVGGSYKGKYRNGVAIGENTVWTKDLFNSVANEASGDLTLPLVITEELWSKFGFKGNYTLPENYKLFITEFTTSGSDKLNNATIKVGLVGKLQVDGKEVFIYFGSKEDIGIGPDKVNFKDVFLHLAKDTKLDESVTYLSSGNGDKTSESGSYVGLDCTTGIHNFNLQGNYTMPDQTLVGYDDDKAKGAAIFGFSLIENNIDGNDELLSGFIAPLKQTYKSDKGWKEWSFSTNDDRHILFGSGSSFESYLDYSSSKAVPNNDSGDMDDFTKIRLFNEYFKGIIFQQMEFKVPMLEQKRKGSGREAETFKDKVLYSFYEIGSKSFFSNYEGVNKVVKEDNARLGGWLYRLDTVSFKIEYNQLDADKLLLKGATQIPLFRQAPDKDKEKWEETFTDAWVPYELNIEYNTKEKSPEISGSVDGIEESLFELNYIHGLGLKLDEESSIDFVFDSDQDRLIARANLSGRSIYYIESLDAKIPLLKFQDFNVNYDASGMCRSNDLAGIESVSFGTWSIVEFSDTEKAVFEKVKDSDRGQQAIGKIKENKFVKSLGDKFDKLNKLASFDVNIHEPSFLCTGSEWKLIIGLDLSIMRDKGNLTGSQQDAYDKYHPEEAADRKKTEAEAGLKPLEEKYKAAQKDIKTIADQRSKLLSDKQKLETEIKTFNKDKSITINGESKAYNSANNSKEINSRKTAIAELNNKIKELDAKYKTAQAAVKENYKPYKEQAAKVKAATNEHEKQSKIAIASKKKYDESGIKDRLKEDKQTFKDKLSEAKETKTGAFSASGDIEVSFNGKGYKSVALTCLALGGEFGPVKFDGGINLFRDETTKGTYDPKAVQSAWGNGFLGMIRLRILEYEFATKFQTGVKLDGTTAADADDYRYWFADLSFNSSTGIPLGQSTFNLTGAGGGFYYNMARVIPGMDKIKKQSPPPTANNDLCKADGMEAGKSLSGFQYSVSRGSMGGYIFAEVSHPARVSIEGILSLEISIINSEFKFKNFGFNLNGYALYEDYWTRKTESTLIAKGEINLNFEENFKVLGGIDFRFGKKAGPLEIAAPENKNSDPDAWNSIRFCFSKDLNYVHAGSWGIPGNSGKGPSSGLNFLSASIEAPLFGKRVAGLYAQIGNKTDGLPTLQYLLPDYNGKVKSLKNTNIGNSFAANAGFHFAADLGSSFLIFSWSATAKIGANLAIENMGKGVTCNGVTNAVGFSNGYYLRGNAFLDLKAKADIDVWVGKVNIFDASVGVVADFGFPNPSYLQGDFLVEYSVLGGSYKGKQNMVIDLGEKPCGELQPNPSIGIKVHKSFIPENGATNIKSLQEIGDNTHISVNQKYLLSQKGDTKEYLQCVYDKFELIEKATGKIVKTETYGEGLDFINNYHGLLLSNSLAPNTTYKINVTYKWLKIISVEDKPDKTENFQEEKVESEFTTGMPEDIITQDMLEYQVPGYRQRYWYKNYDKARIKFSDGVSQSQIDKLFPEEVEGRSQLYFAVIKENKTDGRVLYHKTPVLNTPDPSGRFDHNPKWKPTFNVDKTLLIPGLDTMSFDKGSFCTMVIFRSADKFDNWSIAQKYAKLNEQSTDGSIMQENADQKIIYTTHFAISQYSSVYEKLRDVKVSAAISTSSIAKSKREMFMSSEQVQEIVDMDIETLELIPKNVYYGIKGSKEGIDSFDFNKIKNNVTYGFTKQANYTGWTKKYYFEGGNMIFCNNNFQPNTKINISRAKVLDKFTNNLRQKNDGFTYNAEPNEFAVFSTNVEGNKYEITSDEIAASKLSPEKVNFSMGDGPFLYSEQNKDNEWNPDLILEDGIASTAALQYLFLRISILKALNRQTDAFSDGNGAVVSKYGGTNKYFTVGDPNSSSVKKFLLEKYYPEPSTLLFEGPDTPIPSIIQINPETLLFKNIVNK